MNWFACRLWVTAGVVVVCYCATTWVRAGYSFTVVPLDRDLESIPLEIAGWKGVDVPLEKEVLEVLNAQSTLNRTYRKQDGTVVVAHVSAWLTPETVSEVAPHVPKLCYTNSGWKIVEETMIPVKTPGGDLPLTCLLLEKPGERIVVAYWYQMGSSRFNSAEEARRIHRSLWGQRQWPATIKVLLQTPAESTKAGMPAIEQFALLINREISSNSEDAKSAK